MQRLIFYGLIILFVVLLIALLDVIIYWMLRIFLPKTLVHTVNSIIVIVGLLAIGIAAWWGHSHTRRQIVVHQVEVASPRLPEAFDGYRIAQISDLHLNSFGIDEGRAFLARLADTLQAQQPDLIVFTGDLVTIRAAESYPFREALSALSHIQRHGGEGYVPVYSILGNHDYADYVRGFSPERRSQDVDSLIDLQTSIGWHVLKNSSVRLNRALNDSVQQEIILAGVENIGEPPFSTYGDLDLTFQPVGGLRAVDSLYTVLLTHNPTHWRSEVLPRTAIDLSLAGHTHATQILIGSWSPAKWKYSEWMGLYDSRHQADDSSLPYPERRTDVETPQYLYVNTGIGCVGPAVRIGIPPEVTVLTLHR